MIERSSVWRGSVEEAYRSHLEKWMRDNSNDESDEVKVIDLSDYPSKDFSTSGLELFGLNDDQFDIFGGTDFLIIKNINAWNATEVKSLVSALDKSDKTFVVGFTQNKDADAIKVISDKVDEDFDYVIPKTAKDIAKWMVDYYLKNDARLSLEDAFKLVEFCGEDKELLIAIARTSLAGNVGNEEITWGEHLSKIVTKMGFVAPYKITSSVADGDIAKSIEYVNRVINGGMAPLAILGMLRNRYYSYTKALGYKNASDYASDSGGSPYAAKFVYTEAKTLGSVRIARSIQKIVETDGYLKGGLTGVHPITILEMLVIELANQFRLAKR